MNTTPLNLNWQMWVERWDRMQEGYLVARSERFEVIARLIADTESPVRAIIDLGCGTGSLTVSLLERFLDAQVYALDLDPTLLPLAKARSASYSDRVHFLQADLRTEAWLKLVPQSIDAVVSVTALHWLSQSQIEVLYSQIAKVLKPGGIFLNADHVGSDSPLIQSSWEKHREECRKSSAREGAEDWNAFWKAYLDALGPEAGQQREAALGKWEGIEEGLPLTWHLAQLRRYGLSHVDCFWRNDCDAIYGGLKEL